MVGLVALVLVASLLSSVIGESAANALIFLAYIPLVWISTALAAKRMHDHGKSGWFQLLGMIPLVGIYIFALCGCMRGTVGPNAYGYDPV